MTELAGLALLEGDSVAKANRTPRPARKDRDFAALPDSAALRQTFRACCRRRAITAMAPRPAIIIA